MLRVFVDGVVGVTLLPQAAWTTALESIQLLTSVKNTLQASSNHAGAALDRYRRRNFYKSVLEYLQPAAGDEFFQLIFATYFLSLPEIAGASITVRNIVE